MVDATDKFDFKLIRKEFGDQTEILLRKGVYPYEYINSLERFNEPQLPTIVKEGNPSETDLIKFKISSKTPRGKKDSTKRHHHRHHKRQPGEQQFPKQVVTG